MSPDLRHFQPMDPIGFARAMGPVWGFVGRKIMPDKRLSMYVDIDMLLQALLMDRIVWQDRRFHFQADEQINIGGGTHLRTPRRTATNRRLFAEKWGVPSEKGLWVVRESGGMTKNIIRVSRRQGLKG